MEKSVVKDFQPRVPYSSWLKQNETDDQFKWFLELFKKLHIEYAKFLKVSSPTRRSLEKYRGNIK